MHFILRVRTKYRCVFFQQSKEKNSYQYDNKTIVNKEGHYINYHQHQVATQPRLPLNQRGQREVTGDEVLSHDMDLDDPFSDESDDDM